MLDEIDQKFFKIAYEEAITGFDEGGCPIGGVPAMGPILSGYDALYVSFVVHDEIKHEFGPKVLLRNSTVQSILLSL